jgi:hypothetical protein
MDQFLENDTEPKIGIFWYDPRDRIIFGVRSEVAKSTANPTINILHKQVWAKEYNKRKQQNLPLGRWAGDYTMTPRGRVFHDKKSGEFIVKVGSWIEKYPEVQNLILQEFDLPEDKTTFEKEIHWEIGQGYEG